MLCHASRISTARDKQKKMSDLEDLIAELHSCFPSNSDNLAEKNRKSLAAKEVAQEIKNLIGKLDRNEGDMIEHVTNSSVHISHV